MPRYNITQQVGYIRESIVDQKVEPQLEGVNLDRVFKEKISGTSTERPKLEECLAYLQMGDTLHIQSMDRLARNIRDLQQIIGYLMIGGVIVKFHKEDLTFTNEASPISELMHQMMDALTKFESTLIKERQLEGIAKAKKEGRPLGRKPSLYDEQLIEIKKMIDRGRPKTEVADHFKVSRQTIYRLLQMMGPTSTEELILEKIRNGEIKTKGPLVIYK